jgi:hypothetical protein
LRESVFGVCLILSIVIDSVLRMPLQAPEFLEHLKSVTLPANHPTLADRKTIAAPATILMENRPNIAIGHFEGDGLQPVRKTLSPTQRGFSR